MIQLECPYCGTSFQPRSESSRSASRCPSCRRTLELPPSGSTRDEQHSSGSCEGSSSADSGLLRKPEAPDELGRLGNYRVLRIIGSGSMGTVYEAEDLKLYRRVALKVMKKARARKITNREQFLHEARATAKIEHDHIVTIYQVDEDAGVPFLAMKLLVGESLEDRLSREAPLHPAEVIRIGREVAEGLEAAHERGLIHRDIKPANIWLEEGRDRVKIVDFGLARSAVDSEADEAEKNYLIGTPLYMSPEQARGSELDTRTDLFSLGAVLYRASTGRLPFQGRTARSVIEAVKRETPPPPRQVNPSVPPYLSRLIMDLLEKSPDNRPYSARSLITALDEALDRVDEKPPENEQPVEPEVEEVQDKPRKVRRPKPSRPKRKGPTEYTLEGKVIWWSIFVCIFVAIVIAIVHAVRLYLAKRDEPAAMHIRPEPWIDLSPSTTARG